MMVKIFLRADSLWWEKERGLSSPRKGKEGSWKTPSPLQRRHEHELKPHGEAQGKTKGGGTYLSPV